MEGWKGKGEEGEKEREGRRVRGGRKGGKEERGEMEG